MTAQIIELAQFRPLQPRLAHDWDPAVGKPARYAGLMVRVERIGPRWATVRLERWRTREVLVTDLAPPTADMMAEWERAMAGETPCDCPTDGDAA